MLYLDNAATTFPKPGYVISELNDCIRRYCANPGRSSHKLSVRAIEEVYKAREAIAALLKFDKPENVVFTENATYALNLAIKTAIPDGAHVLISNKEHNSVVRPLEKMKRKNGVSYTVFNAEGDVIKNISELMRENTKAIVCTSASNVDGSAVDIKSISKFCKEKSLLFIIDASQRIGHHEIDLSNIPCSILCAPGHKALFGLQGVGFALFCDEGKRESFIEGGSGGDSFYTTMPEFLPERYEAGTLPTPSIVALRAGIEFIGEVGIDEIANHLDNLTSDTVSMLSCYKEVENLRGFGGVVTFNLANTPSYDVAEMLDKYGVCVRAGYHCAPGMHKFLGTEKHGSVRISFSYLNKKSEINYLDRVMKRVCKELYR